MEWKKVKKVIKYIGIIFILLVIIGIIVNMFMPEEPIGEKIALVEINGAIYSSQSTIDELHKYMNDVSVKAIVLRIDSPGGAVGPAQEIYEELTKIKKGVIASMGSMAASGGYYIACAADRIFANPGTLTGSIGVIMQFPKIEELSKKIGIDKEVIKSGNYKDSGSMYRSLTPEEKELFQGTVDDVYEQFIDAIIEGRKQVKLSREQLKKIADGRVMSGRQALKYKLIDELGNLDDAIDYAGKIGGIEGRPKVVRKKPSKTLLERMIGLNLGSELDRVLKDQIGLRYELLH